MENKSKKGISLFLCASMILAGCGNNTSAETEETTADTTIAIAETIGLNAEPISPEEAKEMLLSYWETGVKPDMNRLRAVEELKFVSLDLSQVDLSILSELTNLKELILTSCEISDISALKDLTNLTVLGLANNYISDISPIKNLTNLNELYLVGNLISDISAVKKLTNLTRLDLFGNQISDISTLKKLKKLTILDLRHNDISSSDFKSLEKALPDCRMVS